MKAIIMQDIIDDEYRTTSILVRDDNFSAEELHDEYSKAYNDAAAIARSEWKASGKRGIGSKTFQREVFARLNVNERYYDFLISKGFVEIEFYTEYN